MSRLKLIKILQRRAVKPRYVAINPVIANFLH